MVVVGRGGWWAFAAFADLRRASHGHASTCVIGGDHNAKVPFTLLAAPWRTNGRRGAWVGGVGWVSVSVSRQKKTQLEVRTSFPTAPHHTTFHHTTPPCPAFLPPPGAADGVKGTWRGVGVGVGVHVLRCCRAVWAWVWARARARAVLVLSTTHFLIPYNPGASRWL